MSIAPSAAGAVRLVGMYRTQSMAYEAIVRVRERLALFAQICRVLVEQGQARMAWVGEIGEDGWVRAVAHAGAADGYLDHIRVSVRDEPEGRGPTGVAVRERRHVVVEEIASDPRMAPWRDAALARGFRASASFPLVVDERCVAVLTAYGSVPGFFDEQEVELLDRITADLSFALEAMQRDERRRAVEARLRVSEGEFRVAAEAMLDAVAILSPVRDGGGEIVDFRYEYVNDACCTLIEREREHVVGRRVGELFAFFLGSERFETYRRVVQTGEQCRNESVHAESGWAGSSMVSRVLDTIVAPMGENLVVSARDVTERKRDEQELALRAELLDLAHDAVIVREPADSRVTFWNRGAEAIYGFSRAEALDRVTHDLLKTVWPDSLQAADEALERDGQWVGELRHTCKDGRVITVSSRQALKRDEDGRPLAIIELNSDITERERAEQELEHVKGLLELTEAVSKTGGWEYDVRTGTLKWTDEVYSIYGIEKTGSPPEVRAAIAAYDVKSARSIEAAFDRLIAEGEPYDLELGLIAADGERIWVHTSGRPVIEGGRVVRAYGNIADVTERHRSERALRRAREELELAQRIAGLGSFSADLDGREMVWSRELYRIVGRDPAAGPPGADELLEHYVHVDDAVAVRAAFEGLLGAAGRSELDVRIHAGDGTERIVHVIVHRDGTRAGVCSGTAQDVTGARATERALREQTERALHASRAKSEFLARMSHELRTPLNSIIGFSQLLELEGLGKREREHVGYVLKAGGHLLQLINEVLELSKIEAGQTTISPEPVLLADAVADALALVAPLASEHEVMLDVDGDGLAHDGHVHADRQRLQQVLLNVLANAVKYNRPGGRVDITFAITDAGRVRTTIADTGIGIAAEQLPQLFEPFERLGAEATQIEGTGLGLALSKGLIEAMGGTIEVHSQPGVGTTVVLELAGAQRPTGAPLPDERDHELDLSGREGARQTILYIEDNLSNLTLVERLLDRYPDVDLIPAMQATIGLELARQHHPDLIVLDLHLPDMPGAEVLTRLKADPPTREIPVVVLTADASQGQRERVVALGAEEYVTKPLDVARFLHIVADKLGIRR